MPSGYRENLKFAEWQTRFLQLLAHAGYAYHVVHDSIIIENADPNDPDKVGEIVDQVEREFRGES